jgi:hypothetical protein
VNRFGGTHCQKPFSWALQPCGVTDFKKVQ